jgi:hypothetical protein
VTIKCADTQPTVNGASIKMYLAGSSVRRGWRTSSRPCGAREFRRRSTVSDLNIYGTIDAWCNRSIEGEHPYVLYDGIVLFRETEGEVMIRRQLKCRYVPAFFQKLPAVLVGTEASLGTRTTSSGHTVRLVPPAT